MNSKIGAAIDAASVAFYLVAAMIIVAALGACILVSWVFIATKEGIDALFDQKMINSG